MLEGVGGVSICLRCRLRMHMRASKGLKSWSSARRDGLGVKALEQRRWFKRAAINKEYHGRLGIVPSSFRSVQRRGFAWTLIPRRQSHDGEQVRWLEDDVLDKNVLKGTVRTGQELKNEESNWLDWSLFESPAAEALMTTEERQVLYSQRSEMHSMLALQYASGLRIEELGDGMPSRLEMLENWRYSVSRERYNSLQNTPSDAHSTSDQYEIFALRYALLAHLSFLEAQGKASETSASEVEELELAILQATELPNPLKIAKLRSIQLESGGFDEPELSPKETYGLRHEYFSTVLRHSGQEETDYFRLEMGEMEREIERSRDIHDTVDMQPPSREESLQIAAKRARNTFGDSLPADLLSEDEFRVYERLYGPPLRNVIGGEETEFPEGNPIEPDDNVLLAKAGEQDSEEIEDDMIQYGQPDELSSLPDQVKQQKAKRAREVEDEHMQPEESVLDDLDIKEDLGTEAVEDLGPDVWPGDEHIRTHPLTTAGRFGTRPSSIQMPPSTFIEPISQQISNSNMKNLALAAQRSLGGVGIPYSPSTPRISRTMEQKPIALSASQGMMREVEADVFITAIMPQVYSSVMSVLVEVRKRLGSAWLQELLCKEGGPLILDAGAGGAAVVAWREVLKAEWDSMHEVDDAETTSEPKTTIPSAPLGKATVLTGSASLRHRASKILENTTFLPRLPDAVTPELHSSPQPRKQYDIIIAPHLLWPIKEDYNRKNLTQTLWSLLNPSGGILILLEKGVPRGFEVIAGARDMLLRKHIASPNDTHFQTHIDDQGGEEIVQSSEATQASSPVDQRKEEPRTTRLLTKKETGCIIAPCTNHVACPLYKIPGISKGRKDWCYFEQRYIRPQFLQSILGAKARNHDDVEFSYLAVQRGRDQRSKEGDSLHGLGFEQGDAATEMAFEGYGPKRREIEEVDDTGEDLESSADDPAEASPSATSTEHETSSQPEAESEELPMIHPLSLPRTILTPLKRKGHILIDVCTPSGTMERWMVSRSRPGKQAYRDARKAQWGDLWALGAKSRTEKRLRLGRGGQEGKAATGKLGKSYRVKGKWKHTSGKGGKGNGDDD